MNIAIIEDEILAQQELTELLHALEDIPINILTYLRSISKSVEWLNQHLQEVDVLIMDIELLDGQSFEIFDLVHINKPVIFLTAYDEYAIRAFKFNSIDYLLKPVELSELQQALEKYRKLTQLALNNALQNLTQFFKTTPKVFRERLTIKLGDTYRYIFVNDIAYFKADDKVNYLITRSNKKMIIDLTLNALEEELDAKLFFRVSRKYLVHIDAIDKASKYFNSRLLLSLNPPSQETILISRVKVPLFLNWMGN